MKCYLCDTVFIEAQAFKDHMLAELALLMLQHRRLLMSVRQAFPREELLSDLSAADLLESDLN